MDLINSDIPMGLNMALAQNLAAMEYFANLSRERQQSIIDQTHNIHSKEEMQAFVDEMTKQGR